MNREQTISGYFTAFGETAGNPAAHNELQRRLVLTDLFFLLVFILDAKTSITIGSMLTVGKWRPRLTDI